MPMQPMVQAHRYMVSAGHYLATEAGIKMLEAGGNAIDAGVAAGIALGVVHSDQVQFSGVAPILIYLAERREVVSIAGLGPWPAATQPDVFIRQHEEHIPLGLLRTVVPAAPDAWITALSRYGTMSFAEVAAPAVRYAREGFAVHPVMAHFMGVYRDQYRMFPDNAAIWLNDGEPKRVGDLHVQADLARTIQYMADEETAARARGNRTVALEAARAAFYKGDIARAITKYHAEHDGWLTAADMANYRSPVEKPLSIEFAGHTLYSCQPWCQGPVMLQMLRLLEGVDLKAMGHNSADYIHTLAEAMKLAFADRERYYGDPDHVAVPMERLLSSDYAAARRRLIDPASAFPEMAPAGDIPGFGGVPYVPMPDPQATALHPDTSYCAAVDQWGNVWSATPSDVSFESPVIPGLGIVPSARGAQSFAKEGHASAPAPGKRPRLTPNPALLFTPGKLAMPFGAPGGDTQPQGMMQVLLNHIVWGMDIQDAIEAPRAITHAYPMTFEPHRYHPGRLSVEGRIDAKVRDELAGRGHEIEVLEDLSIGTSGVCAISANLETGLLSGGADPRRAARAMGF